MLCSKCGATIPDDSKFCVHCGNKIERNVTVKITNGPAVQGGVQPGGSVCVGCGSPLAPGARFCTKCGRKQEPQAQPVVPPQPTPHVQPVVPPQPIPQASPLGQPQVPPVSQPQPTPQVQPAPVKVKGNSSKKKVLIVVVIVFLVVDVLAGALYFYAKSKGVGPMDALRGLFGSGADKAAGNKEKPEEDDEDEEDESEEDGEDGSDESKEGGEQEPSGEGKGDVTLLAPAETRATEAKAEYDAADYTGSLSLFVDAMNEYVKVAEENNLKEEAQEGIGQIYWMYIDALIRSCDSLKAQGAYAAGFEQVNIYLTQAQELTDTLTEKGYTVDRQEMDTYKANIVQVYRDMYIDAINEITKRENWSRDEAWSYAEQVYSVKENGRPLLFDEQDLEDPLRLRYVYCLTWITRKRCETGLRDGSLSYAGAVSNMEAILQETDYNPLLLQDIISYGGSAGIDVTKYRNAYKAIVDEIKSGQGLTVGTEISINSTTSVNLNHFWYFNDLDGEDKYKVDMYNGTRAATREWIRNNVPGLLQ